MQFNYKYEDIPSRKKHIKESHPPSLMNNRHEDNVTVEFDYGLAPSPELIQNPYFNTGSEINLEDSNNFYTKKSYRADQNKQSEKNTNNSKLLLQKKEELNSNQHFKPLKKRRDILEKPLEKEKIRNISVQINSITSTDKYDHGIYHGIDWAAFDDCSDLYRSYDTYTSNEIKDTEENQKIKSDTLSVSKIITRRGNDNFPNKNLQKDDKFVKGSNYSKKSSDVKEIVLPRKECQKVSNNILDKSFEDAVDWASLDLTQIIEENKKEKCKKRQLIQDEQKSWRSSEPHLAKNIRSSNSTNVHSMKGSNLNSKGNCIDALPLDPSLDLYAEKSWNIEENDLLLCPKGRTLPVKSIHGAASSSMNKNTVSNTDHVVKKFIQDAGKHNLLLTKQHSNNLNDPIQTNEFAAHTVAQKNETNIFNVSEGNNTCRHKVDKNKNMMNSTRTLSLSSRSSSTRPKLPHPDLEYSERRISKVEDEHRENLINNAKITEPLKNGWSLYPHQKDAVLKGIDMRRLILAYDMGLGKTVIGCVWAKAFLETFECLKIILIVPVSLQHDWKKAAEDTTGIDHDHMMICTWGKIPTNITRDIKNFVVICDEAHQMQSIASARTKHVLNLTNQQRCVGCLLLTGTPMRNGKPLNLFPLLKAVKHPFGDKQKLYEIAFCNGKEKYFSSRKRCWDANGSSNLEVLNAHIVSHVLHCTKEECLKNLPPKSRIKHSVAVSSRFQIMYTNAMNDLARVNNESNERSETANDNKEIILSALSRVRFASSLAKIDATVALALSILEKEPAVVIFTSYVDVAKSLCTKIGDAGWSADVLTGETPNHKRPMVVDNFQKGLTPVFVATFGAGGVGLTLTAASSVILLDRPWTPGDAMQAEDRVHRIGQTKPVRAIWITAFEVDDQIDAMIERKKSISHSVIDGGGKIDGDVFSDIKTSVNNERNNAPKISIMNLVKKIVPKHQSLLSPDCKGSHSHEGFITTPSET